MRRLGFWSALFLFGVGVAYIVTLAVGLATAGLTKPIVDPVLATMEGLTLLSAPLAVVTMSAVYSRASTDYRICSLVALIFMAMMAAATMSVHFVELTALRQMGSAGLAWPSVPYALELLAWDVFLGLSLLFAAPVFRGSRLEESVRVGMLVAGSLCIAGTSGPALGDMRFQFIAVAGYVVVLPVVFLLLALLFRRLPQPSLIRSPAG
jgi:hypothetical protein